MVAALEVILSSCLFVASVPKGHLYNTVIAAGGSFARVERAHRGTRPFLASNFTAVSAALETKHSLHLCAQKLLALFGPVSTAIFDSFLEVLSFLRYDYQGLLVLAEGTNLLALRRNVKLL